MPDYIANESANNLKHIQLLKLFLWTIGSWPAEHFGETMHFIFRSQRIFIPVYTISVFFAEANYLWMYHEELTLLDEGHLYITMVLTSLTAIRVILSTLHQFGVSTNDFIEEFHLSQKDCKNIYKKQITVFWEKVSHYFSYYSVAMMLFGMIAFNALPAYNSYKLGAFSVNRPSNDSNVTYIFSVYWAFPKFNCLDHYFFSFFFNFLLSYQCTISVSCLDLLITLVAFQIIAHIKILINKIETIPKPIGDDGCIPKTEINMPCLALYDQTENDKITETLVEIVAHHIYIIRFCVKVSNTFGPILGVNYLIHLIIGCLLLLECSRADISSMATYLPLSIITLTQLVQASVVFEVIHSASVELIDAVYCMPWESMSPKNKYIVKFFLSRVQTPIQLTAMGIVPVGVMTMQAILKTTFSYYAMLRSKNV